ncbi:benzoyl-CoA reductase/2-hydroxyglutaryl-CoA dehydratase subunit, BcrC/BadD/HgdB [Solibacillus silvestris StLB046]|uniref:Benzoyl-CoA reductase/2-hydroxyglutaryl-CoA dehydratase subunit, BcrC/BadD/HgdB n=1 Tax=Solibacillus silvestris (strain StLB046) TaxID=1002809 RepID=F2F2I3_SOLSS|nr:2-hydroxyglutaryl-CoA dehydratase [Solibacillus silvestris]BAK15821.1 benzoyl-CoA reductase/2-hydroxyglutaryl-CoA dehydratase subunit, BcrC/BadD/HgdB [Solibacillus silvestris StLB046]
MNQYTETFTVNRFKSFESITPIILDIVKGKTLVDLKASTTGLSTTYTVVTEDPIVETQYVAKAQGKGTSKYLGVYFNRGKWRAKIVRKQKVLCETFETEIDAAKWYDRMAIKFDGPDAVVNFPNTNTKVAK